LCARARLAAFRAAARCALAPASRPYRLPSRAHTPPPSFPRPTRRHLGFFFPFSHSLTPPPRRPARFDWWRADWNPITWDAEEWFIDEGREQAPWIEHTLALIDEGWENLNNADKEVLAPVRVPPPVPAVLSEFEIFVRQQVDLRRAEEAAEVAALQASIGQHTRTHHDTHNRDVRVARRKAEMPNYRPRSEWSAEEIEALIACPPRVHEALIIGDPRFKASYRDLRPYGADELEHLDQIGRLAPDGMFDPAVLASANLGDAFQGGEGGMEGLGGMGVSFGGGEGGSGEDEMARGGEDGEPFGGADELQAASADELAGAVDIGDDDF
jgi:hypothetical protein